jgi:cystathionine beta-lyase/cystathionine gamma-synthase
LIIFTQKLMHFDTLSVHAGHLNDEIGSVMSPIHVTTTFERDEAGNIGGKGYIYTRWDNPNRKGLEIKLAMLEGGEEAFAFPSGMSAAMTLASMVSGTAGGASGDQGPRMAVELSEETARRLEALPQVLNGSGSRF